MGGGLNAFYWFQIFTLDSAVVEVQEMVSSHGGLLTNAMYHNRNHAFSYSRYQNVWWEPLSHSEGPNEQFGMDVKGPRSAGYIVPQPLPKANSFYVIFPHFLSFHVYSWICKLDDIHKGPLDEWTCQIVIMIILKQATMTKLGWNQHKYFFKDFLLFFSVFINIHEYANYANMITCIFDQGMKGLSLALI